MKAVACVGETHAFLGLNDTCICGAFTLPPTEENDEHALDGRRAGRTGDAVCDGGGLRAAGTDRVMTTGAMAQLYDLHRELAHVKSECLQLAEALRQRDEAVGLILDVVAAELRRGYLGEDMRQALALRLEQARVLLGGEA